MVTRKGAIGVVGGFRGGNRVKNLRSGRGRAFATSIGFAIDMLLIIGSPEVVLVLDRNLGSRGQESSTP
jgi:hypothetical protein